MSLISRFSPKKKKIPLRPRVFLAFEGNKTEGIYLRHIFPYFNNITFKVKASDNKSDPDHVVKRMVVLQSAEDFKPVSPEGAYDYAFIILDVDGRPPIKFQSVKKWVNNLPRHQFAVLSNPKFELWLLYHYERVGLLTSSQCDQHLKKYSKNYQKGLSDSFPYMNYLEAAKRSFEHCKSFESPYSRLGTTAMGLFIQKLISINEIAKSIKKSLPK